MNALNAKLPTGVSIPITIGHALPISGIPIITKKTSNTNTNIAVPEVLPSADNAHSSNEKTVSNYNLMEMLLSQNRSFTIQTDFDAQERAADREVMEKLVEKVHTDSRNEPNVSNSDLMLMLLSQNRSLMLQQEVDAKERAADRELMKHLDEKINRMIDQNNYFGIDMGRTKKKRRLSNDGDCSSGSSHCSSEATLVIKVDQNLNGNEECVRSIKKRSAD